MKNKLKVAITIASYSLFIAIFGFGSPDDNPHGDISQDCQDCHTSKSWKHLADPMKFDHDKTNFRLDGSHSKAECASCHKDLVFSRVGTACADCHADHHLGQFGYDCQSCHTPRDWESRKDLIDLHIQRGFPLTGVHAVADCQSCHRGSDRQEFVGTPTDCQSCHMDAQARATDPDHSQEPFASNCENCHRAAFASWNQTTYSHTASFPLTGSHKFATCNQCHGNTFVGTPSDCYDCHRPDFESTTDPNHIQVGMATTCLDCHGITSWTPALFDHNLTSFPLTGAHRVATCISCHATQYAGTPSDCYACHQPDYEASTNPNHVQSGFNTTCIDCHSTNAWIPGTFDHNQTGFPLTGLHIGLSCMACHATQFAGTPSNCYACHQPDYEATNEPDHLAAGFSTDCTSCHSTAGWNNTTWNHDALYFPIYSGKHQGDWTSCSECHTVSADFSVFDCTLCHKHVQDKMDDKHLLVNDYQYLSSACYSCHPDGRKP